MSLEFYGVHVTSMPISGRLSTTIPNSRRREWPLKTPSAASRRDRRPTLLVVDVYLHGAPNAVDVIGVAAYEGIDSGAVFGIDNEYRSDRRFAIVGHQGTCGRNIDA